MCFLLVYYFLVSIICLWAGLLCYGLAGGGTAAVTRSPVVIMLTGLMTLTVGGEWLALFFPLNISGFFVLFALLNVLAGFRKNLFAGCAAKLRGFFLFRQGLWYYAAFAGLFLLILVFNAGPPRMDDTESYHIQAVKWLQTYGTVPGIANLHLRFGFNTAWFSSIAMFSCSSPGFNNYLSLNGLICAWFCLYLLDSIAALQSGEKKETQPAGTATGLWLMLLFALGNWYFLRRSAASTTYDFIAAICLVILFLETRDRKTAAGEWLFWPLFLFTVRMTNFPFLLLSLAYCIMKQDGEKNRRWLKSGVMATTVVAPFLIRNFLLSGYPLFPVTAFAFQADWRSDPQLVNEMTEYIRYFNRVNPMFGSISGTRLLGSWGWISAWWRYLFTPDKITLLAAGAGYLLYFFRKARPSINSRLFVAVMLLAAVSWFFTAPDPRFIQGELLAGILLGTEFIFNGPFRYVKMLRAAFLITSLACVGYSLNLRIKDKTAGSWLIPLALPAPPVRVIHIGGIEARIPEKILSNWNPRCYDVDLPCLYVPDPRLRPRGARLSDGFRLDSSGLTGSQPFGGEYLTK